jgi:Fur family transcriptional regulator, peroxide stress response regulator
MRRDTRQRESILKVLRDTRSHPTADQIYEEVRKDITNISKGTIYRNLQVLEETGAISVLNINGPQSRYEVKQESHYHFKCDKCGHVFDLDEPIDTGIDTRVSNKTGFKVSHHQIEFHGLCGECLSAKSKEEKDTRNV